MPRGARSASPPPIRSSGGSGRRAVVVGSGDDLDVVAQAAPKEAGVSLRYPILTRTNYNDWAHLMRVNLRAQRVWDAIELGGVEYRVDRMTLATILQAVPAEMLASLASKDSAKSAWAAIKTMRMGVDCAREARMQTFRREFEDICMKETESIDGFSMRLTGLVNNVRVIGDILEEEKVVKRFLRVVPDKYSQVAISIEQLLHLSSMTIEELTRRLKAVEDRWGVGVQED